ncbi:ABC transporter ATP-binding protein [bacterium]|nr:ABC transporter ATP-binding protein [bacterium]
MLKILFRLVAYLKGHRRVVVLGYIGMFASIGFGALTPLMLEWAIDSGITAHNNAALLGSAIAIVAFSVGLGVARYMQTYYGEFIAQNVAFDLRRDFYERVQGLSFAFHDKTETGQLMSRATVDVDNCRQFLSNGLLRIAYAFGLLVVVVVIMLLKNWELALVVLASLPFVSAAAIYMSMKTRPLWNEVQQQVGVETSVLQESITGMRVVKALNQEARQFKLFQDANWSVRERSIAANRIAAFNQPFLVYILNAVSLIILAYGGYLAIHGHMSVGTLVAFSSYATLVATPVRTLGPLVTLATRAVSSGTRIFDIIDTVSEVADAPGALPLGPVEGHIRFEDVAFSYSRTAPVVRGINIDAKPGQVVALLGATGSGKTTLLNLLPRFYDVTSGRITIDGTDIRDVTIESLRTNVAVVLQEPFLFTATIRANIAYGKPGATDEEVEAAARIAQVHTFIDSLPDGYDTWVGERGMTLSGGQKQRIAIARTLLTDPRILVLDDSTSSVDMETEYLIQQALATLMKGRTSFVIAHRLRTVIEADQILVLEHGEIVQRGTHSELVAVPGPYREIYDLQLKGQDAAMEPLAEVAG